ncbi:hypothetical protein SAMN02745157_4038 [Kaistia soli DSM 19436]|uniref:Uncharacterized protein n=1 Tax=Kaistia soli DSM 19436 TaxID=1122133 RepID=A0A1M5IZK1_9HYPH|nr:hypothetical protein [Kaistia soli]SHG33183.1 hypothetical protein SAMN02745157_4038 [Kaistia soli DSM 19436]
MKKRPIPETDLARITVLPWDRQRSELEHLKVSFSPYSYGSVRGVSGDILNISTIMLGATARPAWQIIAREIERNCRRGEDEIAANLAVGRALYQFSEKHSVHGRREEFFPLTVGVFAKLRYWSQAVVSIDGRPSVVHIDPRKSSALDARSRRFVFSVMHQRIRLADPDFTEVTLGIMQVPKRADGSRQAELHVNTDVELYDFEALDQMITTTYEIWWDILAEREAKRRGDGSGEAGPLFGTG